MAQQRLFDFGRGDVGAGRDDHVVDPRAKPSCRPEGESVALASFMATPAAKDDDRTDAQASSGNSAQRLSN